MPEQGQFLSRQGGEETLWHDDWEVPSTAEAVWKVRGRQTSHLNKRKNAHESDIVANYRYPKALHFA